MASELDIVNQVMASPRPSSNPHRRKKIPQELYGGGQAYRDAAKAFLDEISGGTYDGPMDRQSVNAAINQFTQRDQYNDNPNLDPLVQEDSADGYWDAQHRGNKKGSSFIDKGGVLIPADPVGKMPEIYQLLDMLMKGNEDG